MAGWPLLRPTGGLPAQASRPTPAGLAEIDRELARVRRPSTKDQLEGIGPRSSGDRASVS